MDAGPFREIGIVGAGFMGAQLALHCAAHGYPVRVADRSPAALARMRRAHEDELGRRVAAGRLSPAEQAAVAGRVHATTDLAAAVAAVDLAIEAVPEELALKRAVFGQLDRLCPAHAILATNSSALRVALLEDATGRPDRVLNAHFYPPVWQRPMVELMRGTATSEATVARMRRFARSIGMTPLMVQSVDQRSGAGHLVRLSKNERR